MAKELPQTRQQILSNKAQEKNDEIKRKLHTDNRNYNDQRLQIHWKNIEWVNQRSKNVRKDSYSTSSEKLYIEQTARTDRWVGHSLLKELG